MCVTALSWMIMMVFPERITKYTVHSIHQLIDIVGGLLALLENGNKYLREWIGIQYLWSEPPKARHLNQSKASLKT